MKVQKLNVVRFAPKGQGSFYDYVVANVKSYFRENKISPYANTEMWVKTAVMLFLYFVPYTLMVTGSGSDRLWLFLGFWFTMGIGMSGIGTAVMHDANHGTYSPNKRVNNFISYILEIIGGYTVNWRIQHNVLHHTYTNVSGPGRRYRYNGSHAFISHAADKVVSPLSIPLCVVLLYDHDPLLDDRKRLPRHNAVPAIWPVEKSTGFFQAGVVTHHRV
jgi:hypothetical protein